MNRDFPKPDLFEKRGSFEADFEMIQSSEEEEIISSHDSGNTTVALFYKETDNRLESYEFYFFGRIVMA